MSLFSLDIYKLIKNNILEFVDSYENTYLFKYKDKSIVIYNPHNSSHSIFDYVDEYRAFVSQVNLDHLEGTIDSYDCLPIYGNKYINTNGVIEENYVPKKPTKEQIEKEAKKFFDKGLTLYFNDSGDVLVKDGRTFYVELSLYHYSLDEHTFIQKDNITISSFSFSYDLEAFKNKCVVIKRSDKDYYYRLLNNLRLSKDFFDKEKYDYLKVYDNYYIGRLKGEPGVYRLLNDRGAEIEKNISVTSNPSFKDSFTVKNKYYTFSKDRQKLNFIYKKLTIEDRHNVFKDPIFDKYKKDNRESFQITCMPYNTQELSEEQKLIDEIQNYVRKYNLINANERLTKLSCKYEGKYNQSLNNKYNKKDTGSLTLNPLDKMNPSEIKKEYIRELTNLLNEIKSYQAYMDIVDTLKEYYNVFSNTSTISNDFTDLLSDAIHILYKVNDTSYANLCKKYIDKLKEIIKNKQDEVFKKFNDSFINNNTTCDISIEALEHTLRIEIQVLMKNFLNEYNALIINNKLKLGEDIENEIFDSQSKYVYDMAIKVSTILNNCFNKVKALKKEKIDFTIINNKLNSIKEKLRIDPSLSLFENNININKLLKEVLSIEFELDDIEESIKGRIFALKKSI